jgi:hypothetical protein
LAAHELGDRRVQWGYPFVLSEDGRKSLHVGLGMQGVGVIVETDVATGSTRELTAQF